MLSEYSVCIAFNMPIVTDDSKSDSFSPGLPENMPGVVDVRFVEREPAEKRRLLSWEQVEYFTHVLMQTHASLHVSVILCFFFICRKILVFCQRTCGTSIRQPMVLH